MTSRTALPTALLGFVLLGPLPLGAAEWAVDGHGGYFTLTAENSASAVFDSRGGATFGGGARFALDNGIFVAADYRAFSKDGERVFVASTSSPVARLGFPLAAKVNPLLLTGGYRFRQGHLIVPYAGLGVNVTSFKEDSEVAGERYSESRSKVGFHLLGGVEVGRGFLRFAGEVTWSTVPDAVGFGGVSRVYGENNLGGVTYLGKVVLAFDFGKPKLPEPDTP
jgi:hypothetical protein